MTLLLVNVLLALLWVLLWGDLSLWTIAVGFLLGYGTLYLFTRLSPGGRGGVRAAYGRRIGSILRFSLYFLRLLVRSNLQIAGEILTPGLSIRPRILRYEVTGLSDAQTATLANAITLTPGTLVVDVRDEKAGDGATGRRHLYVHAMYAADRGRATADLDALRRRLMREVFDC